ncbi:Metallo-dependent hydrolase [Hypoxylon fragiforme]|uniref:Metallo-dependent hydrolase n=1 Tax=Hypoxylon fragiforme TaxID=63214 RepID=UPI0020C5B793|nr:Metallo-dependent hydrolase [Hypoxylon fragiforme]KAI2610084.1 Metallo-dependent hydrolase [Hypoxylon fragiforme]
MTSYYKSILIRLSCGNNEDSSDTEQPVKKSNKIPHRKSRTSPFRHFFDKMTNKSIRLVPEPSQQLKLDFQKPMMELANSDEKSANEILLEQREADDELYGSKEQSQRHAPEDHFLRNVHIIEKTQLLKAARYMPKGAHLHIHFNSTLLPSVLLDIAKEMSNMYISSPTHKLRSKSDFDNCEIVFMLHDFEKTLKEDLGQDLDSQNETLLALDSTGPNLFREDYEPRQQMRYQHFRAMWDEERKLRQGLIAAEGGQSDSDEPEVWDMNMECDKWLTNKLIFTKEEIDIIFNEADKPSDQKIYSETQEEKEARQQKAEESGWPKDIELNYQASPYKNIRERAARAWEKFNGRTRMMKGLFNYEKAFRAYTRKCLEEFVRENVQYAEIRPNFMKSNQVLRDSGSGGFDNFGLMEIIVEEYERFMKDIGDMDENGQIKENRVLDSEGNPIYPDNGDIPLSNDHRPSFGGMKVIYCTPRSFAKAMVKDALQECIQMKKRWPQYIAGFDLVGEESYDKPHGLRYFEDEFRQFQENCEAEELDIPFLFHCGETPDDIEDNLDCALDLNAKRVGHGYALPHKPDLMEQMREKNVCVEACPISNMILGLTEYMNEHRIYDLLAHEIHCSLNSDNGTIFGSTLSHDFYEVMVGNRNMNLYGWRQLARWSLDHSCMSQVERERVLVEWERRWKEEFIPQILEENPDYRPARLDKLEYAKRIQNTREAEAEFNA